VLYRDDLVYAGHVHTGRAGTAYRGYLVTEPVRSVEGLGLLTDEEASEGWLVNRLAAVLREALVAEHVHSFVYGGAPHTAAPPGCRRPLLSTWPDAPRIDTTEMRRLVRRLHGALTTGGS
jgi:hypothetical protein